MKRWLVGLLVLAIAFVALVGSSTVQAQANVNQMSEEYAGAAEKDEPALRVSSSRRHRPRAAKEQRFIEHNFGARPSQHNKALAALAPSLYLLPASLPKSLQVIRV